MEGKKNKSLKVSGIVLTVIGIVVFSSMVLISLGFIPTSYSIRRFIAYNFYFPWFGVGCPLTCIGGVLWGYSEGTKKGMGRTELRERTSGIILTVVGIYTMIGAPWSTPYVKGFLFPILLVVSIVPFTIGLRFLGSTSRKITSIEITDQKQVDLHWKKIKIQKNWGISLLVIGICVILAGILMLFLRLFLRVFFGYPLLLPWCGYTLTYIGGGLLANSVGKKRRMEKLKKMRE